MEESHARPLFLLLTVLLTRLLFAQTAPATYWVQFTNKDHTPYRVARRTLCLGMRHELLG